VSVQEIVRQINPALEARLNDSIAVNAGAVETENLLAQVESLLSDLGGGGVPERLNELFDAFSELANNPGSAEGRTLIVEQGVAAAEVLRGLRGDLTGLREQIDDQVRTHVTRVNELLTEISSLNVSIAESEKGQSEDPGLRDRRDGLVRELSELIDVTAQARENGSVDLFVGSAPLLLEGQARPVETRTREVNGEEVFEVTVGENREVLSPDAGRIGALLSGRVDAIDETVREIDDLASALIFEVNRLHSQGRAFPGLTSVTGELEIPAADQALALNDPANGTLSDLPFGARNGSFEVWIVDESTGAVTKTVIDVDLDGIDSTGAAGFGDDTSASSLAADLNGVGNLTATLTAEGRLQLTTSPGFSLGFANDTSGALATLGVNTFFTGADASDIGVRQALRDDPQQVVAGLESGTNEAALAISSLREGSVERLGDVSLLESHRRTLERVAVASSGAQTRAEATAQVRSSLEAQRAAVSGVSVDEESINLLNFQRQYQASARLISTVDQMTQLLLSLV
jgi:flagellar hook-associated protein 1 FlgK